MDRSSQQRPVYFHSESIHFRGTDISQPNMCTVLTALGNGTNLDSHYVLDVDDNFTMFGMTQYNGVQQAPSANGSSSENARMYPLRYHRFPHPPPQQYHRFHNQTHYVQEIRSDSIIFHPPVAAPSYRVLTNPLHSSSILIQDAIDMGARHVGPAPYGIHRRTLGPQNLPRATFLRYDDVALVLVDHHTNMRLDTEDMSYEELLALGEWIGDVKSGLSENIITSQMKTKTCLLPTGATNLEEAACDEHEPDCCIICQDEYENQDKIGILQCGHEYHANCLRKWLLEKNVCPICKSKALTTS